ncbi:MAG: O-antigen ligase family protein [bacterium]|nr:O-antigen ligase family protein [bacterium]
MGKQSREKLARRSSALGGGEGGREEQKLQSKTGLEKTCIFIIRWGAYASLFIPLVIMLQFFFPFVAPKTTIFRILVEVILIAYSFLVFSNRRYRPKMDALTTSLTVFLAVLILASLTGINFSRSFWSTYERMTGIFTMVHLYAFFIVLKSVFKKKEDWEKFLAASVIAGVCLSIYVLKGSEASTRGGGTIGNSSFLAAYLIFDVFFGIILFLSNFLKKGGWPLFWQIFSGISLVIMLPVFLNSTARGAIASFYLGLSLLFFGYLIFSGKKILKRIALILILLSLILAVSLSIIQPAPVKQEIKTTLSDMKSRFVVWSVGISGFKERPILGWGPENFNAVFQKHFNPCMSLPECGNEVWFDRVHNIVFDTLVTTGVVGLASYLLIFLTVIWGLLKTTSKAVKKRNIFSPLGLIAILMAYFFQNLLVFDMINSYLVFFLALAFAGYLIESNKEEEFHKNERKPLNLISILVVLIPMIFIFWVGNIKPLIANKYIIKMVGAGTIQEFGSSFQKSLDTWMEKYETREQATQKLIKAGATLTNLSQKDKEIFAKAYEEVESEMTKSMEENYLDFRHFLFAGELYLASYRITGNTVKLEKAEVILEKAIQLSPNNQQGYWQMTDVKLAQGKKDDALSLLKKAVELDQRVGLAHWYLFLGYKIVGQYEDALGELYKSNRGGFNWRDNKDNIEKVIEVYRALGLNPSLINEDAQEILKNTLKVVEADPKNFNAWFDIAVSYANLGQYDKAREAARKVVELSPKTVSAIEQFLNSLPE